MNKKIDDLIINVIKSICCCSQTNTPTCVVHVVSTVSYKEAKGIHPVYSGKRRTTVVKKTH